MLSYILSLLLTIAGVSGDESLQSEPAYTPELPFILSLRQADKNHDGLEEYPLPDLTYKPEPSSCLCSSEGESADEK